MPVLNFVIKGQRCDDGLYRLQLFPGICSRHRIANALEDIALHGFIRTEPMQALIKVDLEASVRDVVLFESLRDSQYLSVFVHSIFVFGIIDGYG